MERYEDLLGNPGLARLLPVKQQAIDDLSSEHPQVPRDYVDFLSRLGAGDIGPGVFVVYDGLVEPTSIYGPESSESLRDVRLFGDDMQGYCVGFDLKTWVIVEVEPNDWSTNPIADTFEQFIRRKLAE